MKKFITDENKYIEWLENNMNRYELFYFKDIDDDTVKAYFKADGREFCTFYKKILDEILSEENNPDVKN
jgi:hypothetical protein